MKSVQFLLVISLSAFIFSGCVTTRSELNEKRGLLSGDSTADETSNASTKNSVVKSEDLNPVEPTVVESNKAPETTSQTTSRPSPLLPATTPVTSNTQSQYGIEEMRAELAKLSGKVEELEQDKKNQQVTQQDEQNKLQVKIAELEKQLKEKEEQNNGPAVPEGKTPLQAAKDAYYSSKYETAIQYLDSFLSNNEKGKDVEEGVFIRGESYFKLKQYKKAIVDYSKFSEKFPKSNFNSKALLKIAECFDALEMKEDSKAFYQELSEKYPKTLEGKLAKKKLSGKSSKK